MPCEKAKATSTRKALVASAARCRTARSTRLAPPRHAACKGRKRLAAAGSRVTASVVQTRNGRNQQLHQRWCSSSLIRGRSPTLPVARQSLHRGRDSGKCHAARSRQDRSAVPEWWPPLLLRRRTLAVVNVELAAQLRGEPVVLRRGTPT